MPASHSVISYDNTAVIPVPKDKPGWMARHEAINAEVSKGNVDLIYIGDSIVEHFNSKGKDAWDRYYAPRHAVNMGISGDRTQHVLWRLDHGELTGLDPKWVVINIGSNNTSDHNSAAEIMDGIKAVCERVRTQLPHAGIILMSVFPRDEKADSPRRKMIAEINRMIADYAKANGIVNLDIVEKFLDPNGSVRKDLLPDRCHPVEPGYRIWAEALLPYLDSK